MRNHVKYKVILENSKAIDTEINNKNLVYVYLSRKSVLLLAQEIPKSFLRPLFTDFSLLSPKYFDKYLFLK
jgi:hypothetical protein